MKNEAKEERLGTCSARHRGAEHGHRGERERCRHLEVRRRRTENHRNDQGRGRRIDFKMAIKNVGGAGQGEITEFPMETCTSSVPACTVESAEARVLPWPAHLATVAGEDYVVIEKMEINLVLEGAQCALAGPVKIKGTAGGVFSNVSHTITFNKSTFAATGTGLKVGSTAIEWKAVFTTKALGAHKGEDLEA
jgi:hypothetical protein